jgi:hypothetical protein
MDDEVQVVYSADVEGLLAGNDQAVQATHALGDAFAKATTEYAGLAESFERSTTQVVQHTEAVSREVAVANMATVAEKAHAEAVKAMGAAHGAAVPQVAAASAAIREMEGNIPIRAVERFAVNVLGLGPILQAAFPVFGLIALGSIAVETGEKLFEAFDVGGVRARETAKDIRSVDDSLRTASTSLDVQIDKLEQEQARLEKVPFNGTKLALDEASEAAERLQGRLNGVIEAEAKAIGAMSGSWIQRFQTSGGSTKYENVMLEEHGKWLDIATTAQGKLNESKSFGASLQTRLNELLHLQDQASPGFDATGAKIKSLAYENEIKAVQNLLGWQQAEQSNIAKTIDLQKQEAATQQARDNNRDDKLNKEKPDKSGEAVQAYQEELNKRKIADGQYHDVSTAEEIAFWQQKRTLWNDGTNAYREITAKLAELYKQSSNEAKKASLEEYQAYVAGEELKLKAVQKGSQAAIDIRKDEELMAMAMFGAGSKQALEAAAKRVAAELDATALIQEARARAAITTGEMEEQAEKTSAQNQTSVVKALVEAGLMTKRQGLQEELDIISKRDAAELASADAELLNLQLLSLENSKYDKDVEAANKRLAQLQAQQGTDMLNASIQHLTQLSQRYTQAFNTINNGVKSSIDGWLRGTQSFGQSFAKLFSGLGRDVIENLAMMGLKWVEHFALVNLLSVASQEAQTLAAANGAVQRKSINAKTALSEANTNAMKAATGAYASTVDIPIVGPILAPIAAGAAYVAVMGLTALASASGGWGNIPEDQLAMVHKNEMILPSGIAQNVRDMTGGATENHFHMGGNNYSALGTGDMRRLINGSQRAMVGVMKSAIRDGKLATA